MVKAFFERNHERIMTTAFTLHTLAIILWGTIGVHYFFIR